MNNPATPMNPAQQPGNNPNPTTQGNNNAAVANITSTGMVTYANNVPTGAGQTTASLYVGDLHPEITEAQIFDKFSPVGTVISIRVCRDMVSRRSLGYAYVNFSARGEAEKAIETLNFEELKTRQMRIMWSQRDPSLRKSGVGNVFIKNLDKKIQMRDLYDTFSAFGDILSCKIANDEVGTSKGYGFVHFKSQEGADKAIENLHGMMIYEKKIHVCKFKPRSERSNTEDSQPKFNNVFVKNFGDDMTDEKFAELFGTFGKVISIKLERNEDNSSKGFGFVCYSDFDSAKKAVDEMNDKDMNSKKLYVGRAMKKGERVELLRRSQEKKKSERQNKFAPGVNLYVKNLDDSVTDDMLKKEFSVFGNITSAKVMIDSGTSRSKGFGFVCFQYAEEATRAVTEMSGKYVGSKPLYVALAQRKEERRQQLANQYMQRQMNRNNYQGGMGGPGFPGMPNNLYNTMGQPFANQQFAMAINRPNFMNAMPQMQNNQRPRFPPQGQMTQGMRPGNMGGMPGQQFMNSVSQRPNQVMRPMNQPQQLGQSMMSINPVMRAQGPGVPMQRSPNMMAPNTRLSRPQNFSNIRGVNPMAMQFNMPMRMATQLSNDDDSGLKNLDSITNDEARKQVLGEVLFRHVSNIAPIELSAKITGMLLEADFNDVRSMVELHSKNSSNSRLSQQVEKAITVLNNPRPIAGGAVNDQGSAPNGSS